MPLVLHLMLAIFFLYLTHNVQKVVEAHGSFHTATCTKPSCGQKAEMQQFWSDVVAGKVPVCSACGSLVKPGSLKLRA